jgi:tyrosyl-tRNA synthetase
MSQYNSSLLRVLAERGYIHQVTDAAALDALAAKQIVPGLHRLRCHRAQPSCRQPGQIMMLRRLQQAGAQADRLMGGGTTKVGDPVGQGREPQDARARRDRRQHRLDPARVRAFPGRSVTAQATRC